MKLEDVIEATTDDTICIVDVNDQILFNSEEDCCNTLNDLLRVVKKSSAKVTNICITNYGECIQITLSKAVEIESTKTFKVIED